MNREENILYKLLPRLDSSPRYLKILVAILRAGSTFRRLRKSPSLFLKALSWGADPDAVGSFGYIWIFIITSPSSFIPTELLLISTVAELLKVFIFGSGSNFFLYSASASTLALARHTYTYCYFYRKWGKAN